jgi:hypothetical protein
MDCHPALAFYSRIKWGLKGMSMILFAETSFRVEDSTRLIGFYGIALVALGGVWLFVQWLMRSPKIPDPWSSEVAEEMECESARPLCAHCLSSYGKLQHFCSECGAPVGDYNNLMPYVNLFSIGHVLRIGTSGTFKRSPFLIACFFAFSIVEYTLFAPVYWYRLIKNIARVPRSLPPETDVGGDFRK